MISFPENHSLSRGRSAHVNPAIGSAWRAAPPRTPCSVGGSGRPAPGGNPGRTSRTPARAARTAHTRRPGSRTAGGPPARRARWSWGRLPRRGRGRSGLLRLRVVTRPRRRAAELRGGRRAGGVWQRRRRDRLRPWEASAQRRPPTWNACSASRREAASAAVARCAAQRSPARRRSTLLPAHEETAQCLHAPSSISEAVARGRVAARRGWRPRERTPFPRGAGARGAEALPGRWP